MRFLIRAFFFVSFTLVHPLMSAIFWALDNECHSYKWHWVDHWELVKEGFNPFTHCDK